MSATGKTGKLQPWEIPWLVPLEVLMADIALRGATRWDRGGGITRAYYPNGAVMAEADGSNIVIYWPRGGKRLETKTGVDGSVLMVGWYEDGKRAGEMTRDKTEATTGILVDADGREWAMTFGDKTEAVLMPPRQKRV